MFINKPNYEEDRRAQERVEEREAIRSARRLLARRRARRQSEEALIRLYRSVTLIR
ncbi:hypothetical protein [Allonocardiopsis opalescens]|uniref:Uncharacterized protein n=1 Tax=Allonocardiopsis opalescens TaxID=1144618 RepID=A0A2T0QDQ2_9ACTN|nr:hypothetical protein [Allonocardiopsis opalescens]PRY02022.1 hypothetical protein CLV72_101620 [Allonocardiopsis opalescens]